VSDCIYAAIMCDLGYDRGCAHDYSFNEDFRCKSIITTDNSGVVVRAHHLVEESHLLLGAEYIVGIAYDPIVKMGLMGSRVLY
jgi:hypothetical protein